MYIAGLQVEDGIIVNTAVFENEEILKEMGYLPDYEGAKIGGEYNPPSLDKLNAELAKQIEFNNNLASLLVDQEYRLTLLELGVK